MAKIYQVQDGGVPNDAPVMIRIIRICRNCGAKIFSDAPEGLCPGSAWEPPLGAIADLSAPGGGDPGRADKAAPQKPTRAADWLGDRGDSESREGLGRGGRG